MSKDLIEKQLLALSVANEQLTKLNSNLKSLLEEKSYSTIAHLRSAVQKSKDTGVKIKDTIELLRIPIDNINDRAKLHTDQADVMIVSINENMSEIAKLIEIIENAFERKNKLWFDQICYIPKNQTEQAGCLAGFDAENFACDDLPVCIDSLYKNYEKFCEEHKKPSDYSAFQSEIYTRLASRENKQYRQRKLGPKHNTNRDRFFLNRPSYMDDD
jgi:hypothetical protein